MRRKHPARKKPRASPRTERGRHDHSNSRLWIIKSPDGTHYPIPNLAQWCRANEGLLAKGLGPSRQRTKTPLANLAARALACHGQWQSWTVINVSRTTVAGWNKGRR